MNWKKLHFTLFTIFRYFLATMILSYAFAKILGTQFTSQPSTYDQPIGSLSGFNLTWYYYGYSFWYGVVIATSQIASSLLLFFRKTTRIGIVLFLSFMVNILLVDYAYDIHGAKGMATIMTLMAFFIFFSEYPLFIKYFFTEPSFGQDAEKPLWVSKFRKVKWVYIPLAFIVIFFGILALKSKYMEKISSTVLGKVLIKLENLKISILKFLILFKLKEQIILTKLQMEHIHLQTIQLL